MPFINFGGFFHPHPDVTCMFPSGGISSLWGVGLVGSFLLGALLYGLFYLFKRPTRRAHILLWVICGIIPLLSMILFIVLVMPSQGALIDEYCFQDKMVSSSTIWLNVALAGLFSGVEVSFLLMILFWLVAQIPIKWNWHAMRRYPFSFLP